MDRHVAAKSRFSLIVDEPKRTDKNKFRSTEQSSVSTVMLADGHVKVKVSRYTPEQALGNPEVKAPGFS